MMEKAEWLFFIQAKIRKFLLFIEKNSPSPSRASFDRALIDFLSTPAAARVFKAKGMEP